MAKARKPRVAPGDVVADRYRIEGIVGRGGFGAVYRATHVQTGQQVALKILLKNFANAKVDFKRFEREASLVQKLKHPNVVQILDFGETQKRQPFIAFELLHGRALGKVLKDGALPLYRAGEVTRDVLEALEAAHSMGIVHRDIKPQNIFLLENGTAKVLDFGIAKAVSGEDAGSTQLTEAGQMIGTPHYMAPEQVRGNDVVPQTDLYALGLLMAELMTGKRVVAGNALIDIYMTHISDDPFDFGPAVENCALFSVIDRATKKVIEERYASASEMLAALRAVLPGMSGGAAQRPPEAQESGDGFGGTFELPADDDVLESTTKMKGDLSPAATLLMHMPNLADEVNKIEAAAQRPRLDSTVDMSSLQKAGWVGSQPAIGNWPGAAGPGSVGPGAAGPGAAVPGAGAPTSGAPPPNVDQSSSYPPSHAYPSHPAQPSDFPHAGPHGVGNTGVHDSGVHDSGVHTSGLHTSGLHTSGLHDSESRNSGIHSSGIPASALPASALHNSGVHHSGMHDSGLQQAQVYVPESSHNPPRTEMYSEYDEGDDDGGGGGLAWLLIVVAVVALVAAALLMWAPWEETSSLSTGSPSRAVSAWRGSAPPRA